MDLTTESRPNISAKKVTTLPPLPLNKVEKVTVDIVQSIGSIFVIGCCSAMIILFITLGYLYSYSIKLCPQCFFSDWSVERLIHMQQEIGLLIGHVLLLTVRGDVEHEVCKL